MLLWLEGQGPRHDKFAEMTEGKKAKKHYHFDRMKRSHCPLCNQSMFDTVRARQKAAKVSIADELELEEKSPDKKDNNNADNNEFKIKAKEAPTADERTGTTEIDEIL